MGKIIEPIRRWCVICDIDGTLANNTHRSHFVEGPGKKDWKAFFDDMDLDTPFDPVVTTFHALQQAGLTGILCSGRPADYREITEAWLRRHYIGYERLYTRAAGDHRSDTVVKLELLAQIRTDGFEPHVVIDDRASVVAMWRSQGLVCLQSAEGNF